MGLDRRRAEALHTYIAHCLIRQHYKAQIQSQKVKSFKKATMNPQAWGPVATVGPAGLYTWQAFNLLPQLTCVSSVGLSRASVSWSIEIHETKQSETTTKLMASLVKLQ